MDLAEMGKAYMVVSNLPFLHKHNMELDVMLQPSCLTHTQFLKHQPTYQHCDNVQTRKHLT